MGRKPREHANHAPSRRVERTGSHLARERTKSNFSTRIVQGLAARPRLIHNAGSSKKPIEGYPHVDPAEPGPYARRDELASLAGEVKTLEARVNGRANAESARIDGDIKAQGAELRAVLEAIKSLGQSMDLKMKAMEERLSAVMKAMRNAASPT